MGQSMCDLVNALNKVTHSKQFLNVLTDGKSMTVCGNLNKSSTAGESTAIFSTHDTQTSVLLAMQVNTNTTVLRALTAALTATLASVSE